MVKCVSFSYLFLIVIGSVNTIENDDIYLYEDDNVDVGVVYDNLTNDTDDYYSSEARNEHHIIDARPPYQLNHYSPGPSSLQDLTSLVNYNHHLGLAGINKKRKIFKKKKNHYLIPLLLTALAKVAHLLPVVKLTLLALFALILFSKKALFVSLGSLILVLYDTFLKKKGNTAVNIVKDRGSTVPTVEQGIDPDTHHIERPEAWWEREEPSLPKLNSQEGIGKGNKWRRWWAPQINYRRQLKNNINPESSNRRLRDGELFIENIEEILDQMK